MKQGAASPLVLQGINLYVACPIPCWQRSLPSAGGGGAAGGSTFDALGVQQHLQRIPSILLPLPSFARELPPSQLLHRAPIGLVLHQFIPDLQGGAQPWGGLLEPEMKCVGLHAQPRCSVYPHQVLPQWNRELELVRVSQSLCWVCASEFSVTYVYFYLWQLKETGSQAPAAAKSSRSVPQRLHGEPLGITWEHRAGQELLLCASTSISPWRCSEPQQGTPLGSVEHGASFHLDAPLWRWDLLPWVAAASPEHVHCHPHPVLSA